MSAAEELLDRAQGLLDEREIQDASALFTAAERLGADPDRCSGGRWLAAMLGGDFEGAWLESDAIRMRGVPDVHRFWQGEELAGKRVIVRSLHGFGDAVQMLRFAPALRTLAASVAYEVPPRFAEIARCFAGVDEVITWGEDAPAAPPAWDVQVEMMEVAYLLRLTLEQLPVSTSYLMLPAAEISRVKAAMGESGKARCGLVWSCGEWNLSRSLPEELVDLITRGSELEFWSLQGAEYRNEVNRWVMRDANAVCGDGLQALAATIANLDLVITVDTLAAHLAGALGKPVWLLLQHAADWRWMTAREDSPWYPGMRIFRQSEQGDWTGVVTRLREALRGWRAAGGLVG